MIILDGEYKFSRNEWELTGGIKSITSRLKSKGYSLDKTSLHWNYQRYRDAAKLAPKVLSVWSK